MTLSGYFLIFWVIVLVAVDLSFLEAGFPTITGTIRALVHRQPWTALAIWAIAGFIAFHLTGLMGEMWDKLNRF